MDRNNTFVVALSVVSGGVKCDIQKQAMSSMVYGQVLIRVNHQRNDSPDGRAALASRFAHEKNRQNLDKRPSQNLLLNSSEQAHEVAEAVLWGLVSGWLCATAHLVEIDKEAKVLNCLGLATHATKVLAVRLLRRPVAHLA